MGAGLLSDGFRFAGQTDTTVPDVVDFDTDTPAFAADFIRAK